MEKQDLDMDMDMDTDMKPGNDRYVILYTMGVVVILQWVWSLIQWIKNSFVAQKLLDHQDSIANPMIGALFRFPMIMPATNALGLTIDFTVGLFCYHHLPLGSSTKWSVS